MGERGKKWEGVGERKKGRKEGEGEKEKEIHNKHLHHHALTVDLEALVGLYALVPGEGNVHPATGPR